MPALNNCCLMSVVICAVVFITRNSLLRKDTKVVIRSRKSNKERLCNGQKKKDKQLSTKH